MSMGTVENNMENEDELTGSKTPVKRSRDGHARRRKMTRIIKRSRPWEKKKIQNGGARPAKSAERMIVPEATTTRRKMSNPDGLLGTSSG